MESNRVEMPNFEVPAHNEEGAGELTTSPEKTINSPESNPSRQASAPAITQQALPATTTVNLPVQDDATDAVVPVKSDTHENSKIEKQWVDKAKLVINQTKDDPFTQKDQMSRVKADYIQKRFNKTIKVNEATP